MEEVKARLVVTPRKNSTVMASPRSKIRPTPITTSLAGKSGPEEAAAAIPEAAEAHDRRSAQDAEKTGMEISIVLHEEED